MKILSKKAFFLIVIVLLINLIAIGCSTQETVKENDIDANEQPEASKTTEASVVKIGVMGVLSGSSGAIGDNGRKGAEFLAGKINEAGGINGTKIELVVIDDQGNPTQAVDAAQRLIEREGVVAIVNVGTSTTVLASQEVAAKLKVPMVGHIQSDPRITEQGNPYIFRACANADGLVHPVAEFAMSRLGFNKFAIMNRDDGYGNSLTDSFTEKVSELGGEITTVQTYHPDEKDFRSLLRNIQQSEPEAVLLTGFYADSGLIAKQMYEMGLDIQILGQTTFSTPGYVDVAGEGAEGSIFSANYLPGAIDSEEAKAFESAWEEKYGTKPEVYEAYGYDSLGVFLEAGKNKGFEPESIREGLFELKDYPGVTGKTSFLPNGDCKKVTPIGQYKDGKIIVLEVFE